MLNIKDLEQFKACLVARGDLQQPGIDFTETYAQVIKFVSVKVLLVMASKLQLVEIALTYGITPYEYARA